MKIKINILTVILFAASLIAFHSCGKDKSEIQNNKTTTEQSPPNTSDSTISNSTNNNIAGNENFIISYTVAGKMNGVMQILRSGNKFRQNISSEIMGMKNDNQIFILDNNVYSVTEIGGKTLGVKTSLNDFNKLKKTGETIIDFKEFEKFLNTKKITGSENIIGYNCDIYDFGDGVSLSVNNKKFVLKIKSPEFIATANNINLNPSFASNEFELPKDVTFKSVNTGDIDRKAVDSLLNKANQ
ncbi:MAG: hypothetical protein SGI89_10590 [bacterium]|nr:hypothetical protein [bacterium]